MSFKSTNLELGDLVLITEPLTAMDEENREKGRSRAQMELGKELRMVNAEATYVSETPYFVTFDVRFSNGTSVAKTVHKGSIGIALARHRILDDYCAKTEIRVKKTGELIPSLVD